MFPKSWAVCKRRMLLKTAYIQMCGEMVIELIPELACYLSMMEEMYEGPKRAFMYCMFVMILLMDNSELMSYYVCMEGAS